RQRLDRSADRGAGDVDQHSPRWRRHRADVLGGRRRRLAGVTDPQPTDTSRPLDVDTGFWLWVAALPLMVVGYVVDLVANGASHPPMIVYAISTVFVVVMSVVVVTFLILMRHGYRWARTLLTGGGVA